jgi:hypothetical protein
VNGTVERARGMLAGMGRHWGFEDLSEPFRGSDAVATGVLTQLSCEDDIHTAVPDGVPTAISVHVAVTLRVGAECDDEGGATH